MPFEVTSAVLKMLNLDKRKKFVQGATSSGKTYGIIPILYDKALATDGIKITVVAESIPALKDGAVQIFQDFLHEEGRWADYRWLQNPMQYTLHNRSKIQFKSFDTVGKAKAAGKRDILFLNEGNHIPYPIADALIIRSKEIWVDFNADAPFWGHEVVNEDPNAELLKLTYLDNESIPSETLEDLLIRKAKAEAEDKAGQRGYWWNWWQVYGMGEIGSLQGVVFNNWGLTDFVPDGAKLLARVIDFGFSNDPTAVVSIYEYEGKHILDEEIYQTGLLPNTINNLFLSRKFNKSDRIYADSASPSTIEELKRYGWYIIPANKPKDSIMDGIAKMQEQSFLITKRSRNIIEEFRNYIWATDREGNTTNKPIDAFNHGIDGIRYYYNTKGKYSGRYAVG